MVKNLNIIKRDGSIVKFNKCKIEDAILKAMKYGSGIYEEEIAKKVEELAKQIEKDYEGEQLLVVGILKGASVFVSDLIRKINLDVNIDFMSVSSYGNGTESSGTVRILKDLDVDDKKTIIVYNKVDKLELDIYPKNQKDKVYISAKKGINMDKLLKLIEEALMEDTYEVSLLLPYDRGDIFSKIKDKYNVNNFNYEENGISVDVNLDEEDYNIYKDYIIK